MRPHSRGLIDHAIDQHAVAWDVQNGHLSRMSRIRRRVRENRCGNLQLAKSANGGQHK
jgi:hypothetical protein